MCTSAALSKRSAGCCSWFCENGSSVSEFLGVDALSIERGGNKRNSQDALPDRSGKPPADRLGSRRECRRICEPGVIQGYANRSKTRLSIATNGRGKKGGFHARRYLWPNASLDLSGLRSVRHGLGSAAGSRTKLSHILKPDLPAITRRGSRRHQVCRTLGL